MLEAIPRDLRERLEAVGVIYECSWEPRRWRQEFGVDTEPALCALLERLPNTRFTRGLAVYAKAMNRVYFGDGELIPDQVTNALIDAHDQVRYRHRWMAGDILIIDNAR